MTAKDFLSSVGDNIRANIIMAAELDRMVEEIRPVCGECRKALSEGEIKERQEEGLNLFDPDTVCDKCYQEWQNELAEERKHPDEK